MCNALHFGQHGIYEIDNWCVLAKLVLFNGKNIIASWKDSLMNKVLAAQMEGPEFKFLKFT